jgi:hypothetical protein
MSYLQGKKNLYSLISSSVINYIKDTKSMNNELLKSSPNGQVFLGIPNNLVSSTTLFANCGNDSTPKECTKCLNTFDITDDMLQGDKYTENIDVINKLRKNECFGVCSCNVTSVSLSTNLIFSTGVNINSTDLNNQDLMDQVKSSLTSVNKSESSSKSYNWLYSLLGAGGAIYSATNPTNYNDIEDTVKKIVTNMTMLYSNTINQLITSSQEVVIQGTGIRINNISMESIQNITMTASQQDCGPDGKCMVSNINDLTNQLMQSMTDAISQTFTGMFSYAFQQNKTLIIAASVFITGTLFLWVFLLFKKAALKKN